MKKEILALVFASACASGLQEETTFSVSLDGKEVLVTAAVSTRSDCINVVEPALQNAFERASDRILQATGVQIDQCPGGTPLDLGPMIEEGTRGETGLVNGEPKWVRINQDMEPENFEYLVTHELAHWMTRVNDHSESGLMRPGPWPNDKLNEESLNFVCEHTECLHYQPEK